MTLAGLLVRQRAHGHHVGTLWLIATLDMAAMVYMFAMTDLCLPWLTVAPAAWFVIQATGWTTARLSTTLAHGSLGDPPPNRPTTTTPTPTESTANHAHPGSPPHLHRGNAHRNLIRATLAMMSMAMAYMLIAMQFGTASMPGM